MFARSCPLVPQLEHHSLLLSCNLLGCDISCCLASSILKISGAVVLSYKWRIRSDILTWHRAPIKFSGLSAAEAGLHISFRVLAECSRYHRIKCSEDSLLSKIKTSARRQAALKLVPGKLLPVISNGLCTGSISTKLLALKS